MMTQSLPLAGLRVLDFTTFLSGPYATQLMGDLGAEVIKVETREGDSSRAIPSHEIGEDSGYYLANNRNKKSVSLNLKSPEGQKLARRLALECDIVIENFRPGVAERLGLDARALTAEKPSLIWASISGFGQTGPWRTRPAYDMIVQALSGVMSLTGEPGGNAVRLGIPMGDIAAGLFSVIGILSAVNVRHRTGHGDIIDVAMLDCMLNLLSYQGVYSLISGRAPGPQGARHDSIPTYRSFRAGDGREFVTTANTERMWAGICTAIERRDLIDDPLFSTGKLRLANRDALWPILEAAFAQGTASQWVERLQANDVPAALILNVVEALDDARASGREMICRLERDGTGFESLASPIRFGSEAAAPCSYPPRIGEDNRTVLRDLAGLSEGQIDDLIAAGAVYDRG